MDKNKGTGFYVGNIMRDRVREREEEMVEFMGFWEMKTLGFYGICGFFWNERKTKEDNDVACSVIDQHTIY